MRFLATFLILVTQYSLLCAIYTLIDIINREVVHFKAKVLNKRLVSFYADITTQGNDNGGHELPVQIFNLARQIPKKGK